MANFKAIGATSATLAGLIRDRYPRDEFGTTLNVELYQTRNFEKPMENGFSIYLYRVAINGTVRNTTYRRTENGQRFRPSLPLDLYYMITPWAESTESQHRMLGWVMRMLEDVGTLSSSHLNHYVAETNIFAETESIDLICEPLALNEYFTIWDRLRTLPLSMTYVLRMVMVDSGVSISDGSLVQTRSFDMGELIS
ncbi:hypothetical protein Nit79A3_1002 [Nitrosomonas sp. Is79A3]|uniref:Pvc16 family protein n=1 Tax=Nitrosomonas sp. (strain Is79A3) TaxID=261292 RepID=UPI000215C73B